MRVSIFLIVSLTLMACQNKPWALQNPTLVQPTPLERIDSTCVTFLGDLDAMSLKELKAENDRWQKALNDKRPEDDIRASLVAGIYQAKIKNYERAIEFLSPLSNKKNLDEGCRVSIRLYSDLLSDTLTMEKDLLAEKKQKGELERKLKALSEIEKDISRRDSKSHGL